VEVDECLESWVRRRLAQRFRENRNGEVVVLELGEEEKGLSPQRAAFRVGQQFVRNRSGARPFPCGEMRTSGGECPSLEPVARVGWGQAERVLGELGRDCGSAAVRRETRGVVEHGGDPGVRRLRRQGEVTGTEHRVVDDERNALVNAAPVLL
jgi:hypothetical protein